MMIIDLVGWIGSAMVVMAYAMNMYGKLAADDLAYYLLNITGSACLIANTVFHHAIPSAVVNIIWVLIAGVALYKKRWIGKVRSGEPNTSGARVQPRKS